MYSWGSNWQWSYCSLAPSHPIEDKSTLNVLSSKSLPEALLVELYEVIMSPPSPIEIGHLQHNEVGHVTGSIRVQCLWGMAISHQVSCTAACTGQLTGLLCYTYMCQSGAPAWGAVWILPLEIFSLYCKISDISCTKSQNLNVSHLVLQLSLPNPFKPGVNSRMKM